jgi:hypothetical protein
MLDGRASRGCSLTTRWLQTEARGIFSERSVATRGTRGRKRQRPPSPRRGGNCTLLPERVLELKRHGRPGPTAQPPRREAGVRPREGVSDRFGAECPKPAHSAGGPGSKLGWSYPRVRIGRAAASEEGSQWQTCCDRKRQSRWRLGQGYPSRKARSVRRRSESSTHQTVAGEALTAKKPCHHQAPREARTSERLKKPTGSR